MKIEFDNQNKIIIASKSGEVNYSEVIELINEAVAFSLNHNCYGILFDMTEAEETYSFINEYNLNQNLLELTDLTRAYRCAVLFKPETDEEKKRFQFKETVAENWGQNILKIVFDKGEGIKWLRLHTK